MGFGGIGEMMFILVLGLLLFGPKKLPEIARQVGKILGEFRKASAEFQAQLNDEVRRLETSVSEDESNRSITPPRLQESTARNDVPQYALEPNSGQHEGAVLAEVGGFEPAGFEPVNGSQLSAENQSSAPVAEVQAGASNGANPTEESSKVKDAHDS